MEAKYVKSIKAGAIGGSVIAVILIGYTLINLGGIWLAYSNSFIRYYSLVANVCRLLIYLPYFAVLGGTGALAVGMTRRELTELTDGLIVATLAGLVAGIIWAVTNLVLNLALALALPFIIYLPTYGDVNPLIYLPSFAAFATLSGLMNLFCCAPIYLVLSVVIAGVCGAIYLAFTQDKVPAPPQ